MHGSDRGCAFDKLAIACANPASMIIAASGIAKKRLCIKTKMIKLEDKSLLDGPQAMDITDLLEVL